MNDLPDPGSKRDLLDLYKIVRVHAEKIALRKDNAKSLAKRQQAARSLAADCKVAIQLIRANASYKHIARVSILIGMQMQSLGIRAPGQRGAPPYPADFRKAVITLYQQRRAAGDTDRAAKKAALSLGQEAAKKLPYSGTNNARARNFTSRTLTGWLAEDFSRK